MPAIALLPKPHYLPGIALGIPQSSIAFQIEFRPEALTPAQRQFLPRLLAALDAPSGEITEAPALFQALIQACLLIQRRAGIPISLCSHQTAPPRGGTDRSRWRAFVPATQPKATVFALHWVIQQWQATTQSVPSAAALTAKLEEAVNALKPYAAPGINRYSLLHHAYELQVPVLAMTRDVIAFGQGHKTRLLNSTITDRTPAIGVSWCTHKTHTAQVLRLAGYPGALHERVDSEEHAVAVAQNLGYPVVVKPADQEQGRGIAADLRRAEDVIQAYRAAREVSQNILVEKHAPGFTHRLTVFEGRTLRVNRRIAGGVVGDGHSTIRALLAAQQQDPLQRQRARRRGRPLLELDAEALQLLAQDGLTAESVLPAGRYFRLRRRDNINAGGNNQTLDLTEVHPDNLRLAEDVARLLRLDFAGIDLITPDIGRSWLEVGGLICEVNAKPQMGANSHGDLYRDLLLQLLGGNGQIPVHLALTPSIEPATAGELAMTFYREHGLEYLASARGLWHRGRQITPGFRHGFEAARGLLLRPEVTAAVCLMTPDEIFTHGLPTPRLAQCHILPGTSLNARSSTHELSLQAWLQPHLAVPAN